MAQTFGCPPHVLETARAPDGLLDLRVFAVGSEIEAAISKAQAEGRQGEVVIRQLERAADAEDRLKERQRG